MRHKFIYGFACDMGTFSFIISEYNACKFVKIIDFLTYKLSMVINSAWEEFREKRAVDVLGT